MRARRTESREAGTAAPGPVPVRKVQERSLETRARLVDSAVAALAELGYAGATTPLIAERAGLTRGALQHHFPSRSDLDVAVIDRVAEALNFRLDVESLRSRPIEARVDALIDAYWKAFASPLFTAALDIWLVVLRDPVLAGRLREHLGALQQRVDAMWRRLFEDTGRDAEALAALRRLVMSTARGHAVERMFHPQGTGRAERALLREAVLRGLEGAGVCAGGSAT